MILSSRKNVILDTFRKDYAVCGVGIDTLARSWVRSLEQGHSAFTLAQGKRVQAHAYKVLSRLARCICADMLPEGQEPRPCPQHGWLGERASEREIRRQP